MSIKKSFVIAGAATVLGTLAVPSQAAPTVVESFSFKGLAATHTMWYTGMSREPGLIQPDGKFSYEAPSDEPGDHCIDVGSARTEKSCKIELKGGLTSTKNPVTGEPVHGPYCDRTTGVNGHGTFRNSEGVLYKVWDVGWVTSAGGSVVTGRWKRVSDGATGKIVGPVATRRGSACASEGGANSFSVLGRVQFVTE